MHAPLRLFGKYAGRQVHARLLPALLHVLDHLLLHALGFLIHHRLGDIQGTGRDQRIHYMFFGDALELLRQLMLHVLADVSAQRLHGARLHTEGLDELLVDLRQLGLGHPQHLDLKSRILARQMLGTVVVGEFDVQRALVACLGTEQSGFETGDHRTRAEDQWHILRRPAFKDLTVDHALEIHVDGIAVTGAAFDVVPHRALLAQFVDHLVDVALSDLCHRPGNRLAGQVADGHFRHHLEGRGVTQASLFGGLAQFHLRLAGRHQFVLACRLIQGFLDQGAVGLLTDLLAEALLDGAHRHLAGAKTVQARMPRQVLELFVHHRRDPICRQIHQKTLLETFARFNRNLHSNSPRQPVLPVNSRRYSKCPPPEPAGYLCHHRPMVRKERLELSRVAPLEPKSSASTSSATLACSVQSRIIQDRTPPETAQKSGISVPNGCCRGAGYGFGCVVIARTTAGSVR